MKWQPVLYVCGTFLVCFSVVMAFLPLADFLSSGIWSSEQTFFPVGFTSFTGFFLFLANRDTNIRDIDVRHAFLLTTLLWGLIPIFAGLPFYFHPSIKLSFYDAWFEAVSILTTTGLSVLENVQLPLSLVVWKLFLCFIGGIGMVLMGMIVLPVLRIGGMSFFRAESSESSEKIMPHVAQIAVRLVFIYTIAMVMCWGLLLFVRVPSFEALCLAISSVATCGFFPESNDVFNLSSVEMILTLFMFFGGSSLYLYLKILKKGWSAFFKDRQFIGYAKVLICFSLCVIFVFCIKANNFSWTNIVHGLFNGVSFMTTTGFQSELIASPALYALLLIGGMIGGCTGSTSGGIKIMRFQIVFSSIRAHIASLCQPSRVFVLTYQNQKISPTVLSSVYSYVSLYFLTLFVLVVGFSLFNYDLMSSLFAATSVLSNTGAGFGHLIGPGSSLTDLSLGIKFLLMAGMILGRLELLTVLTLLTTSFWKK